ncbi:MAG: endonuclease/exonuclease/phosphatase family protein [Bacteroidales bacterium]|nr:endonuclease/exonuclease/phosphatase family protein [Bacteroidales bacterium]
MKLHFYILITVIVITISKGYLISQKYALICFYNVENLYDTIDDPYTDDNEFLPNSKKCWNTQKYKEKLKNLSFVISDIGASTVKKMPDIIGLCEVENKTVLADLIASDNLQNADYDFIHYDSRYYRGVDVAFIYNKKSFVPLNSKPYKIIFQDDTSYTTRDILLVSGLLYGELIHVIVNHWPSRRGGEAQSEHRRIYASKICRNIVDSLLAIDTLSSIILIGDFNDDPTNKSIKEVIKTSNKPQKTEMGYFYNPTENLFKKGVGSLAFNDKWNLFDQVIVSYALVCDKANKKYKFYKAGIFNAPYLQQKEGKFKGYPFRTYVGDNYIGGYSDHFPSYCILKKKTNGNSVQSGSQKF